MEGSEDPLVWVFKVAQGRQVHELMPFDLVANKVGNTDEINKQHKKVLDNMKMYGKFFQQQAKLELVDIEGVQK